ncbi:PREDICTED: bumetanide-sensitive sodium-(potassium)-chloride cotransporter-like [Diuraphis noxia]|uniref:bumetanide-sensitive sodium-(potassium)-chloride cotransporter-like n=1 Tax=Diuraphis noxia TaxID=143948 RepID=UPI000763A320|nr:PREDICTED: bumetanide-sensitive sodium-(potassium)-chloride cotransporter-like [Diuraphis noxia]
MSDHEEIKKKSIPWIDQIQSFSELYHRGEENKVELSPGIKLGWIKGVTIPCLLSTWSVMMFYNMPFILGQAGILISIIIIFLSMLIILFTNFSLSAISTNGKIEGGGLYSIVSQSVGPELGAAIGILLSIANTVSAIFNSWLLVSVLIYNFNAIDDTISTILIDYITLFRIVLIIFMSILCYIAMDNETRIQYALLITIIFGIFNILIGSCIGPKTNLEKASGFTGLNMATLKKNWYSDYRIEDHEQQHFFTVFATFFPCLTGIHAGVKYSSGDLEVPSTSIPKGTLLSILITTTSYILLTVIHGSVQLREASGNETELHDGSFTNCSFRYCDKGLRNEGYTTISLWPISIYFAYIAATISNIISTLIFVPKLLQIMGQDDVFPLLKYLAKGYGKNNRPFRSMILLLICIIIIGSFVKHSSHIWFMASFSTTCFLFAYVMLNLCTFHNAHFKPLYWRPSYKIYNKWISLAAAVICISLMIFINTKLSLIIASAVCVIYIIALKKRDSSMKIQQIKTIIRSLYKADTIKYHIKNYLPNLIVFSGNPKSRKKLVSLAHLITKNNGVQMCVSVEKISITPKQKKIYIDKGYQWLRSSRINSLYVVLDNLELDLATHMIYSCGHGQLRPNITMIGYKSDWLNCPYQDLQTYLNIFNVANMNDMSTIVVRVSSTESYDVQNLLIRNFNHLDHNDDISCETQSSQNIGNQQKTTPKDDEGINILFMCWMETITRGLPPCIIINGSTEQVLAVNS